MWTWGHDGLYVLGDRPISEPVPGNSEGTARESPEECVRRAKASLGNLVLDHKRTQQIRLKFIDLRAP